MVQLAILSAHLVMTSLATETFTVQGNGEIDFDEDASAKDKVAEFERLGSDEDVLDGSDGQMSLEVQNAQCVTAGTLSNDCTPCLEDRQCAQGGFCSPYMKKCVTAESTECPEPWANCPPGCTGASCEYPVSSTQMCHDSSYPTSWQGSTCWEKIETYKRCVSDVISPRSKAACQAEAESRGFDYYQWRQSNSACNVAATCNSPYTVAGDWAIYYRHAEAQSEPEIIEPTGPCPSSGYHITANGYAPLEQPGCDLEFKVPNSGIAWKKEGECKNHCKTFSAANYFATHTETGNEHAWCLCFSQCVYNRPAATYNVRARIGKFC